MAGHDGPLESGADVIEIPSCAREQLQFVSGLVSQTKVFGEITKRFGMPSCDRISFSALVETIERVRAYRLQEAIPKLVACPYRGKQRLFDERRKAIQRVFTHDGDRGVERKGSAEDSEASEDGALARLEKVVAPVDERPQRLLARRFVSRCACQQPEARGEPIVDLADGEDRDACGGQLDRESDPVESATDRAYARCVGIRQREARVAIARSIDEQTHRIEAERAFRVDGLVVFRERERSE